MIGIIGGSGFYNFLEDPSTREIETPFGYVEFDIGFHSSGEEVCFIPRHGKGHSLTPSNINYRANIFGAHLLEVDYILTTNAVGSCNLDLGPGRLTLPDQIIDFTSGRDYTFFDGSDLEVTTRSGKTLSGVVHTDVTSPFDQEMRSRVLGLPMAKDLEIYDGGTLAVFNGPRYETAAEVEAVKRLGADFLGMTSSPEVFLAKELEIPYVTVAVVTNFAAGLQASLSHDEVEEIFGKRIDDIKLLFDTIISS